MKNKLFFYIQNSKSALEDISTSNLIDKLYKNYDLTLILKNDFINKSNIFFLKKIKKINIVLLNNQNSFRLIIWNTAHFLKRLILEKKIYNKYLYHRLELPLYVYVFSHLVNFLKLNYFIIKILTFFLRISLPEFIKKIKINDIFLVYGSPKDSYTDDFFYISKTKKCKSILLQGNWDAATTKPYLFKPNLVLTWGSITAYYSRKIHKIPSISVGSLRFEKHKKMNLNYYRNKLNFNNKIVLDKKIDYIAYVSPTWNFNDDFFLKELNNFINLYYKKKIKILYKLHPYSNRNRDNLKNYENIIVIDDSSIEDRHKNNYYFLKSVKGVITPYSTMGLESLYYKKPLLLLADNNSFQFDSVSSVNSPYLVSFRKSSYFIKCSSKAKFIKCFINFMNIINKNYSMKENKELNSIFSKNIMLNRINYEDRVISNLNKLLNNSKTFIC